MENAAREMLFVAVHSDSCVRICDWSDNESRKLALYIIWINVEIAKLFFV